MDRLLSNTLISWQNAAVALVVYLVSLAFYRLTLHPLARFPGPKLAAISRWYEAYYDVIQDGKYTFKIGELHKEYGPIVRISPYELHINDPVFFDTLYRQDAHYDKYNWTYDAFGGVGATVFTSAHHMHRARRQPLSPFFSKAKVATRRDMIQGYVEKLCRRISNYAEEGKSFDLGAATTAFAIDTANDYILNKSYNSLDKEDFDVAMLAASQGAGQLWRISKHIRGVSALLQSIPVSVALKISSQEMKIFFRHLIETENQTKKLMAEATSPTPDPKSRRTVVHEIMDSKLPPSEKSFTRISEDVLTIAGAGFETTASVLRLVLFHIFTNAEILQRLRTELARASNETSDPLELKALEQLPFLTAIIMEGLRLNPGVATRMARIAPSSGLFYDNKWHIPAGTPVGMTTLLMHTDEKTWPEPKSFNPDRWMDLEGRRKAEKAFAPFSKGTRSCVGMNLAWAEMYLFIASVSQRFDFRFPSATAEDFEGESDIFGIGTKGKGALQAIATYHEA